MPRAAYPPRHVDPIAALPSSSEDEEDDEEEEFDLIEVMNEMPLAERRTVYALKGLFGDFKAVRAELRRELAALQKENHAAVQRLNAIRAEIVRGVRDITAEELAAVQGSSSSSTGAGKNKQSEAGAVSGAKEGGSAEDNEEGEQHEEEEGGEGGEKKAKKAVKVVSPGDASASAALREAAASPSGGIPDFWLTALLNTEVFEAMITERDRAALHFLQDIHVDFIGDDPNKGVILNFDFAANPFFTNATLTKTYHMEFNEDDGEMEIGKIKGCTINWTSPKNNLTVVVKQKKQRNKNTKQIRVVERTEPCESFFNFFTAPKDPNESSGSDEDEDENEGGAKKPKDPQHHKHKEGDDGGDEDEDEDFYEQEVEVDIEAGQALMEMVVPKAAYYYTGKSVEDIAKEICKHYGMDIGGDDDDEEEQEEDEEDDDDNDEKKAGGVNFRAMVGRHKGNADASTQPQQQQQPAAKKGAAQPQECKQQ